MEKFYKVMIVDDEFIIRDGLLSFKWERYGFRAIAGASDGEEALALMAEEPVDLVVTDIRMSVMDGLELSEKIQEQYPATKIVILTGYKEFDYAKRAIQAGVVEYLLKPVDLSDMEKLLSKVKGVLDKEALAAERIEAFKSQLREGIPPVVENFPWIPENYPYEKESSLMGTVLNGKAAQVPEALEDFWRALDPVSKQIGPDQLKSMAIQLLNMLERSLVKQGTSLYKIVSLPSSIPEFIGVTSANPDLKRSLEDIFVKAAGYVSDMNSRVKSSSHAAIREALKYIDEHSNEKFTLNEIAERVYLNASYFSLQFKKEVGMNFIDYIKQVRIEKAKELLKRIDLKVYEISETVGYQDYKYFSVVFKELTGLSPMEYRQKIINF